jgi:hypothetical protein
MTTHEQDWEATRQDLDIYHHTLSERMKVLAKNDNTVLPIGQYEDIWPLWMWKRAVERRDQFVIEFLPQLFAWWHMVRPNASVPTDDDPAFKAFCAHLFLRWQWCYFQLVVATAGMPQPLRRRMRLCDLSSAEQQAIRIPIGHDLPQPPPLGGLNPTNQFDPQKPCEPLR